MWESDLAAQRDIGGAVGAAFPLADRQRRPLSDAVGGQDRGARRGGGEKRGGRMRRVMIRKQDLVARHAEMRRNDAADPDLLPQCVLDRLWKRPPRMRKGAQRAGQNPFE